MSKNHMFTMNIPYTYKVIYDDDTEEVVEFETRGEVRWFLMNTEKKVREWELIDAPPEKRY